MNSGMPVIRLQGCGGVLAERESVKGGVAVGSPGTGGLFPRLIRETRRHCGVTSRARPKVRELEQLMGLHGGVFYIGVRRWIYGQTVHGVHAAGRDETCIADLVNGYLTSAAAVLYPPRAAD